MNKKKIITILTIIAILINNISFINAEENETTEEEEQEQEITENYQEQINNLENQINEINDNIDDLNTNNNLLMPLLSSPLYSANPTVVGLNGCATTFGYLWTNVFLYYLDIYNTYDYIAFGHYSSERYIYYFNKSDVTNFVDNGDSYSITASVNLRYARTNTEGIQSLSKRSMSFTFNPDNYVLNDGTRWAKFIDYNTDELIYLLYPYYLTVTNLSSDYFTINDNYGYYIYSPNELITISYDNSNDDFYGWANATNDVILSRNPTYTFNINSDIDLKIIYKSDVTDDVLLLKTNKSLKQITYLIIILLGYLFMKGIISYD